MSRSKIADLTCTLFDNASPSHHLYELEFVVSYEALESLVHEYRLAKLSASGPIGVACGNCGSPDCEPLVGGTS